jgi:SAM-dependent methyltransferase
VDPDAWDERYADADLVWSASANAFVVERLAGATPGRALDVACGEGRNAFWLAEQGWDVVGVDFSAVAIDKAQRIAAHRGLDIELHVGDVTDPDVVSGQFDLVLVAYLHLGDDAMAPLLAHLAERVGAGGTLFVLGHHVDNLEHGHGGPQDPRVLHDPDRIAGWIGELDVVEAGAVTRTVTTDDGSRTAIDSLVVARRA